VRLKHSEIKDYRETQSLHQNNQCALCGEDFNDDAVLDHDHKTGMVRQVLHRGCNSFLGKIENSMPRSLVTITRLEAISKNLVKYMTTEHTDIIHPTYKTREQLKMRAYKKKKKGGGTKKKGY
jgi:hypothetical protein